MSRIRATFSVLSDKVVPDRITDILMISPDHTVQKAERRIPPRPVAGSFGWYVTCVDETGSAAAKTLEALLERVKPIPALLSELRKMDSDVRVLFSLAISPDAYDTPLYFSKPIVNAMATFDADFDIEYFEA